MTIAKSTPTFREHDPVKVMPGEHRGHVVRVFDQPTLDGKWRYLVQYTSAGSSQPHNVAVDQAQLQHSLGGEQ